MRLTNPSGEPKNKREALDCYELGVTHGCPRAMMALSELLGKDRKKAPPEDLLRSQKMQKQAADAGFGRALFFEAQALKAQNPSRAKELVQQSAAAYYADALLEVADDFVELADFVAAERILRALVARGGRRAPERLRKIQAQYACIVS